jgi:hypothetical protein
MSSVLKLATGLVCLLLVTLCQAGSLNPPAAPTAGTMKPLDQVEPRTPITSVPYTISTSGSYYLTQNMSCSTGTAILISADNVVVDLGGFTLTGTGANYGLYSYERTNVEIRNGTVLNFATNGVHSGGNSCKNHRILNVFVSGCPGYGIYAYGYKSASTNGGGHRVEGCTVRQCGNATTDTAVFAGFNSIVKNCIIQENAGDGLFLWSNGIAEGNNVSRNGDNGIGTGYYCTILQNVIQGNAHGGLYLGRTGVVKHNTITENSGSYGLYAGQGSLIENNTVALTAGSDGIRSGSGCQIISNVVRDNDGIGIYGGNGSSILNNTVQNNNALGTATDAGIYAADENVVRGNHCTSNKQYNMYVSFYRNIIENNTLIGDGSQVGIHFVYAGNFYANNRASNHTTAYSGNLPAGAGNGGGNVSY